MKRHTLAVEAFLEVEKMIDKSPDWQVYYYLGRKRLNYFKQNLGLLGLISITCSYKTIWLSD